MTTPNTDRCIKGIYMALCHTKLSLSISIHQNSFIATVKTSDSPHAFLLAFYPPT